MNQLDDRIRDALEAQDRELLEHLGEQGLWGQLRGLFEGKMAWITVVTLLAGLALTIVGFYAAWKFYTLDDTNAMLRWGGLAWFGLTAQMMIKIWSWMRMETNRTLREMKRIELQLAQLQEKLSG